MPERFDSSHLCGWEGNTYAHEVHGLLGAVGEHLGHGELPTQLISTDEELLARLGYKQGSTTCFYFQRCHALIQPYVRVESWAGLV